RGVFFEVYNKLGPGLPEKVYQNAVIYEFEKDNIQYEKEKNITIKYKDKSIGRQRLDLVVDDKVIIEIKATDNMHSLFEKQTIAYLKASDYKLALLVNFGGGRLVIKRFINTNQ
ncbi:MAG: GxxExxY protein, partial [bacterium]|nr:GxxExxY protein [bacterium]